MKEDGERGGVGCEDAAHVSECPQYEFLSEKETHGRT